MKTVVNNLKMFIPLCIGFTVTIFISYCYKYFDSKYGLGISDFFEKIIMLIAILPLGIGASMTLEKVNKKRIKGHEKGSEPN